MYRCEICGQLSQPRQPAFKVTLETRRRFYPHRPKVNACYKRIRTGTKFVHTDDRGGVGEETAREATACAACAERIAARRATRPTRVVVERTRHRRTG